MSICARLICRENYLPEDGVKDIDELPKHFSANYILQCGHVLCEKCLYSVVRSDYNRSYKCEQCDEVNFFSAQVYNSVNHISLSSTKSINLLNGSFIRELPLDAYSFGLAFEDGLITASPVETIPLPGKKAITMLESLKYSKDDRDEINERMRQLLSESSLESDSSILLNLNAATKTHAECGISLKVIGDLENKLTKNFFKAKMELRDKFQHLHSLLQLEETRGINLFEEIYRRRKDEYAAVEKNLVSVRRLIQETIGIDSLNIPNNDRTMMKLKECAAKPCKIHWRNHEPAEEFNFEMDDHVKDVIKNNLVLKKIEKASTLYIQPIDDLTAETSSRIPIDKPKSEFKTKVRTPGLSASSSDLSTSYVSLANLVQKTPIYDGPNPVDVKMGTILSPHKFYVILWNREERNKKMFAEIDKWCTSTSTHPPAASAIKPDKFFFVYHGILSRWCRGLILKVNSESEKNFRKKDAFGKLTPSAYNYYSSITVQVQLLDYGGVTTVDYHQIREPLDDLFNPKTWPFLAHECTLERLAKISQNSEWMEDACNLMKEYCRDHLLSMYISKREKHIHHVEISYAITPYHVQNNIPLHASLLLSKFATSARSHDDTLNIINYDYDEACFTPPVRIPKGKEETVVITSVTNPDLFYVMRYDLHENEFFKLHTELQIYNEMDPGPLRVFAPRRWQPVVAFIDGEFHRARITFVFSLEKVKVQFVDHGTVADMKTEDLRLILEEFLQPPVYAIPCKLVDVGPFDLKWSDRAITKLEELLLFPAGKSHLYNLTTYSYDAQGKHIVNIDFFNGAEVVSVNSALVSLGYAISTGPCTQTPLDPSTREEFDTDPDENVLKVTERIDVNGYTMLADMISRNQLAASSRIDSYIPVKVTHSVNPSEFYVQLNDPTTNKYFQTFVAQLHKDFADRLHRRPCISFNRLDVGKLVVFVIEDEKTPNQIKWRRGTIVERVPPEASSRRPDENRIDYLSTLYKVFARDYGNTLTVKRKFIFIINPKDDARYSINGDFCIRCSLIGLEPAGDSGSWAQSAVEGFEALIKKYEYDLMLDVDANFFREERPDFLEVDIVARHSYIPDAAAPRITRYYSFRKLMVKKGFAVPTREINLSDLDDCDTSPGRRTIMPLTDKNGYKGDILKGRIYGVRSAAQRLMDNKTVRYYKEPIRPKEQSFLAVVTGIDEDLKIWFRLEPDKGRPKPITIVDRTISNALKNQGHLLPFDGEYSYGRACTAMFYGDKTWNRAEIVYSRYGDATYVRFADYGNREYIENKNLSSQVFNRDIPKLAMSATLANCKILVSGMDADNLRWDIHDLIVDKVCPIKWENFQSNQEMKITVVMPDGTDLVQYLIKNYSQYVEKDSTEV